MKKQLISLFTISSAFITIFILAFLISSAFSRQERLEVEELAKVYAVPTDQFSPEPQERWTFVIGALLTPFLCGGLYLFLTNLMEKETKQRIKILHWVVSPFFLYLFAYLAILGLQFAPFSYLGKSGIANYPFLTAILNLGLFALIIRKKKTSTTAYWENVAYWGLGSTIILLVGMETIFTDAEPYIPHIHFIAYFDSVVQVFLGKAIGVDLSPQYGFYAWFLKPIFQLTGLTILSFTMVMAVLRILIFVCILLLLYQLAKSKILALLSFASIFFFTRMRGPIDVLQAPNFFYQPQNENYPGLLDPYFQYNPQRMLFPVLFLTLTWFYLTRTQSKNQHPFYWLITLLVAIAIPWNPDTGLVVLVAWLGVLAYREIATWRTETVSHIISRILRHLLSVAAACAVVIGFIFLSSYLKTGIFPSFGNSADHTRLFYFYGFFMMSMPIIHPWNMVILAYIVGLYFPIRTLLTHTPTPTQRTHRTEFMFVLSLLGVGLFNYYVGRSHEYNLMATVWPAHILLLIYVDQLFQRLMPIFRNRSFSWTTRGIILAKNSLQVGLFLGFFYFLGSSLISITANLPAYLALIHARTQPIWQNTYQEELSNTIQFIEGTSTPDDPVFIISDYAPSLYLYSGHSRPIPVVGFGEIILQSDVEKITAYLTAPPENAKIYWDRRFYAINSYAYKINPELYTNLKTLATSADGNFVLFVAQ